MPVLEGACHCGTISVRFETDLTPDSIPVRACACSFCRAHGASTVSDPAGHLTIQIGEPDVAQRYRFGLRTADFLVCGRCGVYVAAVLPDRQGAVAIVNANTFDAGPPRGDPGTPVSYYGETEAERRAPGGVTSGHRSPWSTPARNSNTNKAKGGGPWPPTAQS